VQHIIFSSLLNVTEITNGRFSHILHFDGKAEIEQYIRDSGVPATFVLAGTFMSNFFQTLKKQGDTYTLAFPVNTETSQIPLFDVEADTGKFVAAALKQYPSTTGTRILAATDYYTPTRIVTEFSEVTGHKAQAIQIPEDTFKSFFPAPIAQELLENILLFDDVGYYNGESLEPSLKLLGAEQPTTWKEFVARNKDKFA